MMARTLVFAACFGVLGTPLSAAQPHKREPAHVNPPSVQPKRPTTQPTETITVEGTITGVATNELQVKADKDQKLWLVAGHPGTKFLVTGTAQRDALRKGLAIKVKALCDGHQVTEPVDELTVVPPLPETFGIFPQGGAAALPGAAAKSAGKVGKPDAEARGGVATSPQMCDIIGRISACHEKRLTVQVTSSRAVSLELSDEPTIRVELADATLVAPPDKIVVRGKMIRGKPGFCQADDVKVTLSEPLSGTAKKPATPTPPSKEGAKKAELPF